MAGQNKHRDLEIGSRGTRVKISREKRALPEETLRNKS